MTYVKKAFFLTFVLSLLGHALALDVPYMTGRVVDQAGILSRETIAQINSSLLTLESQTHAQVAVLTVTSLENEPIETFSLKVVEAWKLGVKGKDNGILFTIAPKDRRMRIEVGYGLEGAIPDALANRILDTIVAPQFKLGNYDQGVAMGVTAIEKLIRNESVPELEKSRARRSSPVGNLFRIVFFIFIFFFIAVSNFVNRNNPRRGGRSGFYWGGGGFSSGSGGWSSGGGGFSGGGGSFGGGGSSSSW